MPNLTDNEITIVFFLFMVVTIAVFALISHWTKPRDLPTMRPMPTKFPDSHHHL